MGEKAIKYCLMIDDGRFIETSVDGGGYGYDCNFVCKPLDADLYNSIEEAEKMVDYFNNNITKYDSAQEEYTEFKIVGVKCLSIEYEIK